MGIKLSKVNLAYSIPRNRKNIKFAVNDVNLSINTKDEFIAIVGHTGSGKSTLVQLFNSLLLPSKGQIDISWHNDDIEERYRILGNFKKCKSAHSVGVAPLKFKANTRLKPLRSHIGLVFQFPEYQLFEETVLKDIMFGPKNFTKDKELAKARALEVSSMMHIESLLEKSPFALSGGQMRKAAIAGILASKPDILVLDEPTVGLDPLAKRELLDFLTKLNRVEHKTIILITHDMDVVGEYCNRTIVMNKGMVVYDGSKDLMFHNDSLIKTYNLDYPNIIKTMINLKNKINKPLNVYQYNVNDAFNEIEKVMGDNHE
ncbi:MAG: ATP-binding cassette domain-containing protein [Bacilli bacterium]